MDWKRPPKKITRAKIATELAKVMEVFLEVASSILLEWWHAKPRIELGNEERGSRSGALGVSSTARDN